MLDKSSGIFLCKMYIVIGVKANDNIWPFQMDERERVGQVIIALALNFFLEIPMDNS